METWITHSKTPTGTSGCHLEGVLSDFASLLYGFCHVGLETRRPSLPSPPVKIKTPQQQPAQWWRRSSRLASDMNQDRFPREPWAVGEQKQPGCRDQPSHSIQLSRAATGHHSCILIIVFLFSLVAILLILFFYSKVLVLVSCCLSPCCEYFFLKIYNHKGWSAAVCRMQCFSRWKKTQGFFFAINAPWQMRK